MTVRARFAPSPTGYLHIGGARTALFSWLYAKKLGGEFVLRIEDTDRERPTQASVDTILDSMAWLELDYVQGPYYQSRRLGRYREIIEQLLRESQAYYCYCTREELEAMRDEQLKRKEKPRYTGRCRDYRGAPRSGVKPVVRFKNPRVGEVVVDDQVHGRVTFDNGELDDLVIARADGSPTYNLTVVVDDMDMAITHVIRGDDHLNNTPRQINILHALGATPPTYAHVPMILGSDGKRLSKRHGAVSVLQYRDQGYLPQALLNYLVRLGWSHGDQEIFTRKQMIELFDIKDINRSAATFNPDKLLWLNQHYIKEGAPEDLIPHLNWHLKRQGVSLEQGPSPERLLEAQRERARTLVELVTNSRFFYAEPCAYDEQAATKHLTSEAADVLDSLVIALRAVHEWRAPAIHEALAQVCADKGLKLGKVAQPLRVAVSGGAVSPPIDITLELLGKARTLARVRTATDYVRTKLHQT
ncbi:MAG: glutamate--tRNA ligase [Pseudomonadota bacterium]|nr:glutamate--tRNA ligase [Pseudomonadota bacterium]